MMERPRKLELAWACLGIVAGCWLATPALAQDGYANSGGSTTGGGNGTPVVCSNLSQFTSAASDDTSRVVHVSGTINLGSSNFRVGANKTILGVGSSSGFVGNLQCRNKNNIILRNLNFTNPNGVGDGDGLTIYNASRVWVDHCTFTQCDDGCLDIVHGADFVTVSWCKFQYSFNTGHNFVNLIGHSDNNASEDSGRLRITFHHNWWSTLCVERMPRVRFGRVHMYNNFFNCSGNNHCIRASIQSHVLAENNFFENINRPYQKYASSSSTGSQVGLIRAVGNTHQNCTNVQVFTDSVFTPPYGYSLQSPSAARSAIISGAGTTLNIGGGGGGGGSFTRLRNQATQLYADGMGRTGNGSNLGQWANTNHQNAHWEVVTVGSFRKFRNRTTSLYIDGMGRTGNGSDMGQWSNSSSNNQQFAEESPASGYYKFRNRATGLYMDGMGRTGNGSDMGQWSSSSSFNQQFQYVAP